MSQVHSNENINTEDAVFEIDLGENEREIENIEENDVKITEEIKKTDQPPKRAAWGNRFSFILSAVGASIGFGNFLRFPYLAFKMGGGNFFLKI